MMKQSKLILCLYLVALYLPLDFAQSQNLVLPRSDELPPVNNVAAPTTIAPIAPQPMSDVRTTASPSATRTGILPSLVPTVLPSHLPSILPTLLPTKAPELNSRQDILPAGKDAKSGLSGILAGTSAPVAHHLNASPVASGGASALPSAAPVTPAAHHVAPQVAPTPVVHADGHEADAPIHRFCDYLRPICDSVDKIQTKQLTKIQTQFKQFVTLTNNKLASCFLEHFSFDPILKPVTLSDIRTVCSSKKLAPTVRGSYKSFESCAVKNWDTALDKELDSINQARASFLKKHDHPKNAQVDHDDDLALISEVVSEMLNDDKSVVNNSDIKVIDMNSSGKSAGTTAPVKTGSSSLTTKDSLMNDPNTLLVFVDDSKTTMPPAVTVKPTVKATAASAVHEAVHTPVASPAPVAASVAPKAESVKEDKVVKEVAKIVTKEPSSLAHKILATTAAPVAKVSVSSIAPDTVHVAAMTTVKPVAALIAAATTIKPVVVHVAAVTTVKPVVAHSTVATTVKAVIGTDTTKKVVVSVTGAKTAAVAEVKPTVKALLVSTVKPSALPVKTKVATSVAPSILAAKPFDTLEEVFKRQEKEKQELENKLKLERERVLKQLQKKQDELDAQNAIKSLQVQRDANSKQTSDAKLHQLEHERQMSIDPVGHQIKHQQYELSKQQRMSG